MSSALSSSGRNMPLKWRVSCMLEVVESMLGQNPSCDESLGFTENLLCTWP